MAIRLTFTSIAINLEFHSKEHIMRFSLGSSLLSLSSLSYLSMNRAEGSG